jgi:hypothetical protein
MKHLPIEPSLKQIITLDDICHLHGDPVQSNNKIEHMIMVLRHFLPGEFLDLVFFTMENPDDRKNAKSNINIYILYLATLAG